MEISVIGGDAAFVKMDLVALEDGEESIRSSSVSFTKEDGEWVLDDE